MATLDFGSIAEKYPDYVRKAKKVYKRNFILLALDSAFFTFSVTLLSPNTVLPVFLNNLTDNPILIGLIPAIYNIGFFLPQIISAYITQNTPKRKSLILFIAIAERIGILLIALSAQSTSQLPNEIVLLFFFLAFSLYSLTTGLIMPAYSDFISKSVYKNRGLFYGINQAIGGVIGFIASLVATKLLDAFSFPYNYRAIFWVGFAFSFISPIIIANFKEVIFPIQPQKKDIPTFIKHIIGIIRGNNNLRKYIYSRQLLGLAAMGFSFYSIYAIKQFNLPDSILGIYTIAILLSQSISGVIWGYIGDKHGYKWVLIISSILLMIQGVIALAVNHPIGFIVISSLTGFIYSAIYISHPNLIFEIAPPEETSLFIGLSNSIIAPVIAIAPIIAGEIVGRFGYSYLFFVVCISALAAFFLSTFVFREPRKSGN